SGGERNRVLLARLFARPSNVLVLDEPTNDLDAETIEVLEERLVEYPGTVLLVSHDREFLNHVVTSTLVLEGGGKVGEYAGGYDDWLLQRPAPPAETAPPKPRKPAPPPAAAPKKGGTRMLSRAEREELAGLPERIESLEAELATVHERMGDPAFYSGPPAAITEATARVKELEATLETAYARWEELEPHGG
ncbi:MAG: ATP-binding cassette domain-containing protein, partial [Planctomycetota bacterium JB042]